MCKFTRLNQLVLFVVSQKYLVNLLAKLKGFDTN